MSETPDREPGLNPALRQRTEAAHDTRHSSPPPADTASVQRGGGSAWPIVWLVVTVVCVAIAIWLLFF